jgi:hypothetical protein
MIFLFSISIIVPKSQKILFCTFFKGTLEFNSIKYAT